MAETALQPEAPPRASEERPRRTRTDILIGVALGVLVLLAVLFTEPLVVGGVLLVASAAFVFRRVLFTWTTMLFLYTAVVMFIPIRRYALPINVGFALEPYRVLIAVLLLALAVTALTKRKTGGVRIPWAWPIAIFLWALLAAVMANSVALTQAGAVTGGIGQLAQIAFLLSTIVIVRHALSTEKVTLALLNFLVIAGAVVGVLAFYERLTRTNIFLQLSNFLPLTVLRDEGESLRAGGARAYASSQHPIALAVLFCMLIPLAIYLMRFSRWPRYQISRVIFYVATIAMMMIGMLAAVSRTGVVVLGVMFIFALLMRPRLAGMLVVIGAPLVVIFALVLPSVFDSMVVSLFDVDALVASQLTSPGMAGQGRLADLPQAMAEFAANPWFGTGLGSRIVVGPDANAQILDNQWLGSLLEAGVLGIVGLIAFFVWPVVSMMRKAFSPGTSPRRAFLLFAISTSAVGYASSMYFYDAFSFMQTLLLLCILLAIADWAMTTPDPEFSPADAAKRAKVRQA